MMRTMIMTTVAIVALAALMGCDVPPGSGQEQALQNTWLVQSYGDDAIKNAIIAQHTLYPYHFVRNSPVLNPVGKHDLTILAAHFQKYPGELNLARGDARLDVYLARVKTMAAYLKRSHVDPDRIAIADGLPGGDGILSDRVVKILDQKPPSSTPVADSSPVAAN